MIFLEKQKYDFKDFSMKIKRNRAPFRAPINTISYNRWGYRINDPVKKDFTLEEIQCIIREGDIDSLRELSNYFYRVNSSYRNNIDFLASLPLYDSVVIPVFEEGKGSKVQITKTFYNACSFIDKLDFSLIYKKLMI